MLDQSDTSGNFECKKGAADDSLMPARDVRRAFNRSDMTIRRWVERQLLPEPTYINGQRYWWSSDVRRLQQGQA
jgi:hypothetical protein